MICLGDYESPCFSLRKCVISVYDIGTEELSHLEMVGTLVQQLTRNLTAKEIEDGGFDAYYVGHGIGVYACSAAGDPFSACATASKGDPITDLVEDMAADGAISH